MIDPAQLRAARGLLRWSQRELAERSGVHLNTIKDFEREKAANPTRATLLAWQRALSKAGVAFIEGDDRQGPGVRLRDPTEIEAAKRQAGPTKSKS
jgi:transcriptional regulator with XRE-family HTH domain